MITLGDLALPGHLVWDGEFNQHQGAASVEMTLTGDEVTFRQSMNKGRSIDLVATTPHLTRAMVEALNVMAANATATYALIYGDRTFMVRFRYEDTPALNVTPAPPRPEYEGTDRYSGTIKLKEV
jgi:hypothetical protein